MERFYIRESTGWKIGKGGTPAGGESKQITEVLVLDRAYCHRVVWTSLRDGMYLYALRLPALRDEAKRLCREWNAEDRADAA